MTRSSTADAEILFVHSSNEMYGADKILIEVLDSLPASDRHRSTVLLPDDLPDEENRLALFLESQKIRNKSFPIPVLRRRYLTFSGVLPLLSKVQKTYRHLLKSDIEVIYCTTSAMVLCLMLSRLARVRRIILHMQEIWSPREALMLGLLARGAHEIFCISDAARESLPKHVRQRAVILRNAHREHNPKDLQGPPLVGPLKFVVASRWNSWKGHEGLLAAWNNESPPGELLILGGPPALGEAVDVPRLVSQLKHEKSISIVGEVDDITPYIDSADFLVLPSEKPEPFGLVLLEAFARGKAVIASRAGGVLDIVTHEHDGLLYPLGDSKCLASVLSSVHREDAQRMGVNARQTYEHKFSIEGYRRNFRELWNETRTKSERASA